MASYPFARFRGGLKEDRRIADQVSVRVRSLYRAAAVCLLAVVALASPVGSAWAHDDDAFDGATRVIIQREPGLNAEQRAELREDAGVVFVRSLPLPDTEVARVADGDVQSALDVLAAHPDVDHVEVDQIVRLAAGDDPLFGQQWALAATTPTQPGSGLDVQRAWSVTKGEGQVVAVVDSGVALSHPDLASQLAMASAWDYIDNDAVPADGHGHGTHVAGIIAAAAGNDVGIAGVAPEAKILPLRTLNDEGKGVLSNVVSAFDRAGKAGVRIVNASFGVANASQALKDVIVRYPSTLFVAAAGNTGINVDASPVYPCALPDPNVVCVGATGPGDLLASFANGGASNTGAMAVDLFAPGAGILSTWTTPAPGGYTQLSGTSMAAPHVAAALALARAADPTVTVPAVKQRLLSAADRVTGLSGLAVTGGRLDIGAAVQPSVVGNENETTQDGTDGCAVQAAASNASASCQAPTPTPSPSGAASTPSAVATPAPLVAAPGVLARLSSLAARGSTVTACTTKSRTKCKERSAVVEMSVSAAVTVELTLERNECRAKGCRWSLVERRRRAVSAGRSTWEIGPRVAGMRLRPGGYRASARIGTQERGVAITVR